MPFKDGIWRPNPKQERFLSLPDSIDEAFYGGAVSGGKSEVLLMYPIIRGWYKEPGFKQLFLRRTYPEIRNEILPRSRLIYPHFGGKFNKSDMTWEFECDNGSALIFFGHCENESDVSKYDSMEINLFTPDELTSETEYIYFYIGFTRVRTSNKKLPAIIRAAGMPGGVGHSFVKRRFIDPCPDGFKRIKGKGGNVRIFIPATLVDNKENIDPNYEHKLDELPEAERKAKKFGDWNAYQGQVFEEFREFKYPSEPDNALHVIEPIDIPEWWPKIVAIDWGFAPPAMTWVGYGAISPDKRLYIYREQYWQKTKIEEWGSFVREYVEKELPRTIKLCKSAGQDRGQEHTILQQVSDALGVSVALTTNSSGSRVAGKQLLHEYLRWKTKHVIAKPISEYNHEKALWIQRNRSVNEYNSYMMSFQQAEPEINIPKLQIFDTCSMLINAIKACTYDKTNTEDVAEFPGDDPYDGIRYLVDAADRYFDDATAEFAKVQKTQELINTLNNNGDWTAFYRNSRRIENESSVNGISRYHHRVVH